MKQKILGFRIVANALEDQPNVWLSNQFWIHWQRPINEQKSTEQK